MTIYADLLRYRELFGSLFRRDLRAKYKGSILGVLWSLAHPVLLMLVYLVVFSLLLEVQAADYPHYWLFLLAGLPAWVFFATSLQAASRSLVENANLIRKVRFPRQLVPLSMVATQLVSYGVMLAIVVGLSLVYVPEARDTVWLSVPLAALVVGLVAGLALAVSSLNALYRDVEHVVAALLLPWFFLTPVLYSLENIPAVSDHPRLVDVLHWGNPLTPAVEAVRDPLFFGTAPSLGDTVYLAVSAVLALALGAVVFERVDDRVEPTLLGPLAEVADELVLYPYEEPVDRPVGWVHALCRGDWILWLDDDELASSALVAQLETLVRAREVTHYWLPRRWLYRDGRSVLDRAPWYPDYQLRLVRNDPALLWFPGITHWPIEAIGPHRYLEAPLYHLDLLLNPLERRRAKSSRYERLFPGKRVAGLPLNHALYLPEERGGDVVLASVPNDDAAQIEAVLASEPWAEATAPPAALRHATREEVDRHWHGRPAGPELYRGRLEPVRERPTLAARETRSLDVWVANDGTHTWPPGTLGFPQVRVSYRWRTPAGDVVVADGLRTPFPHAVRPGEAALVPVDVTAPPRPGRYVLELDLVHEHVRWFGSAVTLDVDVAPQPLVLLAGADETTLSELAAAVAEAAPAVEPAYVGTAAGGDGYRAVPGARRYVLEGGRASRPATLWRAGRLLVNAWRLRRGGRPTVAGDFLRPLAEVGLVLDLGRQRGRRERLQHWTAMRAARTLGIPVVEVAGPEEALAVAGKAAVE